MSAAAATAMAFNLICTGTYHYIGFNAPADTAYETVYRIDLEAGRYCENSCRAIFPIAAIQPAQITFKDNGGLANGGPVSTDFVNRETGAHYLMESSGGVSLTLTGRGTCRRADFTGFPALETQF